MMNENDEVQTEELVAPEEALVVDYTTPTKNKSYKPKAKTVKFRCDRNWTFHGDVYVKGNEYELSEDEYDELVLSVSTRGKTFFTKV